MLPTWATIQPVKQALRRLTAAHLNKSQLLPIRYLLRTPKSHIISIACVIVPLTLFAQRWSTYLFAHHVRFHRASDKGIPTTVLRSENSHARSYPPTYLLFLRDQRHRRSSLEPCLRDAPMHGGIHNRGVGGFGGIQVTERSGNEWESTRDTRTHHFEQGCVPMCGYICYSQTYYRSARGDN